MNRKEITKKLSEILINTRLRGFGKHWASEVTIDWGHGRGSEKRIDFMLFEPENQLSVAGIERGTFTCYEVKSCREDVYSGNGLTFIGDKNYLVTTMQTWKDIQDDWRSGKLDKHIRECNPESTQYYGIMVAVPLLSAAVDEYKNPTPLDDADRWELHIVNQCRSGYRKRSITELLFYMLRSGH